MRHFFDQIFHFAGSSTAAVCGLLSILQNKKKFDREAMERAKTNGSRELSIIYCGMNEYQLEQSDSNFWERSCGAWRS